MQKLREFGSTPGVVIVIITFGIIVGVVGWRYLTQAHPLEGVKEEVLLDTHADCLSKGYGEHFCQCTLGENRENIPLAWFDGTEDYKDEWTDLAFAACQQHFTPTPIPTPSPTPVPFDVDAWDPYTPIPDGLSYEDSMAAYEKWGVEYERLTEPWRAASDRVKMAWDNVDTDALLIACRHWNDVQSRIWTPELRRLNKAVDYPSQHLWMDCRNMILNIFVPGAKFTDYIADAQ